MGTIRPRRPWGVFLTLLLVFPQFAEATQVLVPASQDLPCGVLDSYFGTVHVMDSSRKNLLETKLKMGIPCGSWLIIEKGWAEVVHRQGYQFRLGDQTMLEVFDRKTNPDGSGIEGTGEDQVVLYKGKVYARVAKGMAELRVATPNSRVLISDARATVVFSQFDEESQLMVFENKARIANRFEDSVWVDVHPGEASSLNFRLMRVVPSNPMAMSIKGVKTQMDEMGIEKREMSFLLSQTQKRAKRKFAEPLVARHGGERQIASDKPGVKERKNQKFGDLVSYERHPASPLDAMAEKKMMARASGGDLVGARFLGSIPKSKKARKVSIETDEGLSSKSLQREKKTVFEELSRLRPED